MATETKTATKAQDEKAEDGLPGSPLVASPTGPVPVSALAATPEDAAKLRSERTKAIREEREHPRASDLLDEETVRGMNGAERYTVARQRGYEVRSRRISADRFLELQQKDEQLKSKKS